MKIKVSEATPVQLDWLVAKCEGHTLKHNPKWRHPNKLGGGFEGDGWYIKTKECFPYSLVPMYSTNWAQGGPIIEREKITIEYTSAASWHAAIEWDDEPSYTDVGPTPLIAAMRCYVASKMGDEVEIPEELA